MRPLHLGVFGCQGTARDSCAILRWGAERAPPFMRLRGAAFRRTPASGDNWLNLERASPWREYLKACGFRAGLRVSPTNLLQSDSRSLQRGAGRRAVREV